MSLFSDLKNLHLVEFRDEQLANIGFTTEVHRPPLFRKVLKLVHQE